MDQYLKKYNKDVQLLQTFINTLNIYTSLCGSLKNGSASEDALGSTILEAFNCISHLAVAFITDIA